VHFLLPCATSGRPAFSTTGGVGRPDGHGPATRVGARVERMSPAPTTVPVGKHLVHIERIEKLRWRVTVDGQRLATFCTESRARAAGRLEARRLDFAAGPAAPGRTRG